MATSLEQRAVQLGKKLGDQLSPVISESVTGEDGQVHTRRTAYFYSGKLEEIDGDCWAFSEAVVADSFLSVPA